MLHTENSKGILVIIVTMVRQMLRWVLLIAVTAAVTIPLDLLGVPSAALFAALTVGIVLALSSLAPSRVPRKAGIAAQGVLGVYIGTMVHQDAVGAHAGHLVQQQGAAYLALEIAALEHFGDVAARLGVERLRRGRELPPFEDADHDAPRAGLAGTACLDGEFHRAGIILGR